MTHNPAGRPWLSRGGWELRLFPSEDAAFGRLVRHRGVFDAGLAIVIGVATGLADTLGSDYRAHIALGWDLALAAPLVIRRRRPALAAGLIAAICLAQWLADVRALGDVAVLVALYSLGAYDRRRWILLGAVVVSELGVVMAVTRWGAPTNHLVQGATATGTVTASWVFGIYVSMRRAYLVSMRERAETAERDRDHQAQIAVAAERTRLAREMHDVIAHSLSVMITLNDAAAAVVPMEEARDAIGQASEVGRQALVEMHRMLGVLRDGEEAEYAPQPGVRELPQLVSMVRSAGLRVELAVTGDLAGLSPTAQLALYRIIQESLTNVLKHGRNVESVDVVVERRGPSIDLRVDNDGSPGAPRMISAAGHGLSGMDERARLFGGEVVAGPVGQGGWSVHARLNVDDSAIRL